MMYYLFSQDVDDQEAHCLWGYRGELLAAGAPLSSHVQPINQYQIQGTGNQMAFPQTTRAMALSGPPWLLYRRCMQQSFEDIHIQQAAQWMTKGNK